MLLVAARRGTYLSDGPLHHGSAGLRRAVDLLKVVVRVVKVLCHHLLTNLVAEAIQDNVHVYRYILVSESA